MFAGQAVSSGAAIPPGAAASAGPADGQWIVTPRPQAAPRVRLLCFPYAGGGIGIYRPWLRHLPDGVELSLVQLPGRDRRAGEPPMRELPAMIAALGTELAGLSDAPLVLFGHSMGALLAYEAAHWLRAHGHPAPRLLAVSGRRAPHLPSRRGSARQPVEELSDDQFAELVLGLDGTPPSVLANPELRAMFLPILRADFIAVQRYRHEERPPLTCPISAFAGTRDPYAPVSELSAWAEHTSGGFDSQPFAGNHFFLREHRDGLLAALFAHG